MSANAYFLKINQTSPSKYILLCEQPSFRSQCICAYITGYASVEIMKKRSRARNQLSTRTSTARRILGKCPCDLRLLEGPCFWIRLIFLHMLCHTFFTRMSKLYHFFSVQHVIHLNGFSSTHLARTAPGL
jgi:hypothetical protein